MTSGPDNQKTENAEQSEEQFDELSKEQSAEDKVNPEAESAESVEGELQPEASEQGDDAEVSLEDVEAMQVKIAQLEKQVQEADLRAQAEIQNVRRRTERDVANAHKFGQEKLIKELLAVVDSLDRGIQTIDEQNAGAEVDESVKSIRDGSELTLKMFIDVLAKFSVVQVDPAGEPFDPSFHEAISMIDNPDAEPNSVIAVVQKGYTLNDRLVRPAMVVVSKP